MEAGTIYHLHNHANGFENLFREEVDYELFLQKLLKFTSPVANYYAYCLMPNHFHLLAEIKPEEEILRSRPNMAVSKRISRAFASAFAGFAKSINNKYSRMGSLFKQNTSARLIKDEIDFCSTTRYIHTNPVHHGFVEQMHDWKYSSFLPILENNAPWLHINPLLDYFGNLHEFIKYHNQPIELKIKEKSYF